MVVSDTVSGGRLSELTTTGTVLHTGYYDWTCGFREEMESTDAPSTFTFRNGRLTIEDGVISIEGDYRDAIRRHYRHHKLVVGGLCLLGLLFAIMIPVAIVFDPGYVIFTRELGILYGSMVVVPLGLWFVVDRIQSRFTLENSIAVERVDYVLVRPATRFFSPRFRIVYDDESKIRQIFANIRGFGGKQQAGEARRVFGTHDIEVREE